MEEKIKKLYSEPCNNYRQAIGFINMNNIQREDLYSIVTEGEGVLVLYYK